MKRNLLSVCTSALLVLGLSFAGVTAANAEDVVAPEATASEAAAPVAPVTEATPAVEAPAPAKVEAAPAVVAAAEPAPVADPAPAVAEVPAANAARAGPVTDTKTLKVSICHTGNGKNFEYIAPAESGAVNGHRQHEGDQFGLTEAQCAALNPVAATQYHPVIWVGSYLLNPKFPQNLAVSLPLTESLSLQVFEDWVKANGTCHTTYQGDFYLPGAATDKLIASGVLTGSGEQWVGGSYKSEYSTVITTADCAPTPPPTVKACPTIQDGGTSTNLNANGWTFGETRATGHNEYVKGGIHVFTESNTSTDKAAGYHALNTTISGLGKPSIEFGAASGVKPGLQIVLSPYQILVGEPDAYGDNFWSSKPYAGVPAGMGYAAYGTLDQYLQANDAKVVSIGYSLGSGVKGDAVIKSITGGCFNFKFDREEPVVVPPKPEDKVTTDVVTTFDCTTKVATETTTTTTVGTKLEGNKWVATEPVVVVTTATRPMTDDEIKEECPVTEVPPTDTPPTDLPPAVDNPPTVNPPAATPPTVTDQVVAQVQKLASTGADIAPLLALMGGLLGLGLAFTVIARQRRKATEN
jgi:hypothetical protein